MSRPANLLTLCNLHGVDRKSLTFFLHLFDILTKFHLTSHTGLFPSIFLFVYSTAGWMNLQGQSGRMRKTSPPVDQLVECLYTD